MNIQIGSRTIGLDYPTYFIADVAANHDGDLQRAKLLIRLAKQAGADAAKFQNFRAPKIVSDYGFRHLGGQVSHQAAWKKSVFQVYEQASIPFEWTTILKEECDQVGIDFFSAPYDFEAIDMLDPYVLMYKAGSGEIDWIEALERMASKGKPFFVATGASSIGDVQRAVDDGARAIERQRQLEERGALPDAKRQHQHGAQGGQTDSANVDNEVLKGSLLRFNDGRKEREADAVDMKPHQDGGQGMPQLVNDEAQRV